MSIRSALEELVPGSAGKNLPKAVLVERVGRLLRGAQRANGLNEQQFAHIHERLTALEEQVLPSEESADPRLARVRWCDCGQPWIPAVGLFGTSDEPSCIACAQKGDFVKLAAEHHKLRDAAHDVSVGLAIWTVTPLENLPRKRQFIQAIKRAVERLGRALNGGQDGV
jgi:hypothetical protein